MVFFSAILPELLQRGSGVLPEKAAEIGRIVESKLKGNLFSRNTAGVQQLLGFVDHPVPDEFSGGDTGCSFGQFIQTRGVHVQHFGIG